MARSANPCRRVPEPCDEVTPSHFSAPRSNCPPARLAGCRSRPFETTAAAWLVLQCGAQQLGLVVGLPMRLTGRAERFGSTDIWRNE